LESVGKKLKLWAESSNERQDLFGRSAYNRFYYASYLLTREALSRLDSKWGNAKHKNIPGLLTTAVRKPVKTALKRQFKKGLITHSQHSTSLSTLNQSTLELSELLLQAYDLRCIADYEPGIPIIADSHALTLKEYKLNTAEKWPRKTSAFCKSIQKVWEEAGLV